MFIKQVQRPPQCLEHLMICIHHFVNCNSQLSSEMKSLFLYFEGFMEFRQTCVCSKLTIETPENGVKYV